ncbi:hypothetical protein IGI04_036296 [Brassica rapa subsp. trilocularis]|uniref:EF-hand domain-containing protein n=1 Tax=Brassica rapa subsp. trilocularis TaxID=1813537 RepID=A0ABQ7LE25_BRACM|nr:hypothetical protein IGI04_036296 [Brassica rapa subsp. trilocularis]
MSKSKSFEIFSEYSIETKMKAHLSKHSGLNQVWLKLLSEAKMTAPYTEEQLLRFFRIFDTDGDGFITAADLVHSMCNSPKFLKRVH